MVTKIWVVLAVLSLVLSAASSSSLAEFPVVHFFNNIKKGNVSLDCRDGGSAKLEPLQRFSFEAKEKDKEYAYICSCQYYGDLMDVFAEKRYELEVKGFSPKRDAEHENIYWMFTFDGVLLSYDQVHYHIKVLWRVSAEKLY
ncbi:unnamed protein product [Cuscuta epithymum]|uniref:S-protein homolog n=1 Tax=Cuscuta epithymum TaxID=186058 RepID=A0AAV0D2Z6_9ASTE|nr:unnamed protein product [Cuscuta epithymum]